MLLEIHEYVHNRSLKRPFTKRCTFRSLLRPKTRIMFTRECETVVLPSPICITHVVGIQVVVLAAVCFFVF